MNYDTYVYPGTNILRNKFDISDQAELEDVERKFSAIGLLELEAMGITGCFDVKHVRAIHRHLFDDVYDWAGEFREVDIGKGGTWFLEPDMVPSELDCLCRYIQECGTFDGVPMTEVADVLGDVLCQLNYIHPFREGNGRTQREFVRQIAFHAGYILDFSKLSENGMRDASRAGMRGNTRPMQYLLGDIIRPCDDIAKTMERELPDMVFEGKPMEDEYG